MIAVSEEMKNEDMKDPSNMEQEASEETASENTETSAEEKTTEKAPEKEEMCIRDSMVRIIRKPLHSVFRDFLILRVYHKKYQCDGLLHRRLCPRQCKPPR